MSALSSEYGSLRASKAKTSSILLCATATMAFPFPCRFSYFRKSRWTSPGLFTAA